MKQKDIALIIIVVFISGVLSMFLSKTLISNPKNRNLTVEVVGEISPEFKQPDPKYFNTNSIDPTKIIRIGDSANNQPFNKKR